jgi:hypothetical protein
MKRGKGDKNAENSLLYSDQVCNLYFENACHIKQWLFDQQFNNKEMFSGE